jgi:sugar porter (SP) family MFS transporter
MLGLAVIPGAMLGLGMLFLPETPRWLARTGKIDAARKVLTKIRGTQNIEGEMKEIEATLAKSDSNASWLDLLKPNVRAGMIIGIGLAFFQQVTGINTVIYYAPNIIHSAGLSSVSGAILATAGIGLVNVIMTIVAMWLIDRVGRRPLLLVGIAGMVICLGLLGLVFRLPAHNESLAWLAVVTLMAYVAFFAISLGPIFWLLISEIYPLEIRGLAEGTAAGSNWVANFAVSLTFLLLVQAFGPSLTFWLYGVMAVAAWLFSYYLVPETKGRSLEEIEESLRGKTA